MKRMTSQQRLEDVLHRTVGARLTAWELHRLSGMWLVRLHRELDRLLEEGVLIDEWEEPIDGRPPRRFYRVVASA